MAKKRNPIVTVTETETITQTKTVKFPAWHVYAGDTQQVRWNKKENKFQFRFTAAAGDEWEDMEWDAWLENQNKGQVVETLTNLLALVKATK